MKQEEIDEIMRLSRNAVFFENQAAWTTLCAYVMKIAAERANEAIIAHDKGII